MFKVVEENCPAVHFDGRVTIGVEIRPSNPEPFRIENLLGEANLNATLKSSVQLIVSPFSGACSRLKEVVFKSNCQTLPGYIAEGNSVIKRNCGGLKISFTSLSWKSLRIVL